MAVSRRTTASALLLLLLLLLVLVVSTEMGAAEVRTCLSQSHNFKGACLSSDNCASVCKTENFSDGDCKTRGLSRRCFCMKDC